MKNYNDSIKEFKKAGLILDTNNDTIKTQYVYGMLNDTSHLMSSNGDFENLVEHLNEQNLEDERHLTYINGKVVITEEFDKAIAKNFQNCANKDFFFKQTGSAYGGRAGGGSGAGHEAGRRPGRGRWR